ncbi:class I SAM-dependent methyltransferase [Hanstruepera flava]|uniref:class I SAM-dependent methyltransferase n=1 Tax=Hanstruepera flava TaxID=2930218 RepID=UPI002027A1AD|nr:class I SAM-dependent methyltransferase [Hanstruepera flava]
MINNQRHPSSFRDPSGYVINDQGIFKRVINPIYFKQYSSLKDSGFFDKLFNNNLLIPHSEELSTESKIIIIPEQIPFITYPYEWCFLQYKEAALLTLKIQKYALDHNYSLKDASAFNVTFHNGQAVFIDTLSFDFYRENEPWRAYKQFIAHFLGPLLLAYYHGAQSLKLLSNFIDGIPIKQLASMLPYKTKLNPFLYSNVHLLAKFEDKHNDDYEGKSKKTTLSKKAQLNIITTLYDYIKKMSLKEHSEWGDYYTKMNYSDEAFKLKSKIINTWANTIKPKTVIDVGGNDGTFLRLLNQDIEQALVCDVDNNAVDFNYKKVKTNKETYMLPFVLDVLNPSPSLGFNNKERTSFIERIKVYEPQLTLALAVIHHITLTGNVTFNMSAEFFAKFSKYLIIEFPKPGDSWVERLLNTKGEFKDHFNFYNVKNFESAFLQNFDLVEKTEITNTKRVMYFLKRK